MRVLLVNMPFSLVERPSLALALLQAEARAYGHHCDVACANIDFAVRVGTDVYRQIASELPPPALVGEWVFAESLFGASATPIERYGAVLLSRFGLPISRLSDLRALRTQATAFVDEYVAEVPWSSYQVVGFTSSFHQNLAALAVARRVKAAHPEVSIVFGGPNWAGEMGATQFEVFPFVDAAFLGEADLSFPALIDGLEAPPTYPRLPGVAFRLEGELLRGEGEMLLDDLDDLPLPDYGDHLRALKVNGLGDSLISVSVETSRGCWWAASGPCSFCGQNGTAPGYRHKSAERSLLELAAATSDERTCLVELTDNVVAPRFVRDVLPVLRDHGLSSKLFFEARPELSLEDVTLIAQAGCRIQVGIESLSDHVLELMKKGTRGLENVRLLKWCHAVGVEPGWNLLFGIPGETASDFEDMLALIPAIRFLHPPTYCGPITIDRFSPYFCAPADFGLTPPRPLESYAHVYPFDDETLQQIAYSFESGSATSPALDAYRFRLMREASKWRTQGSAGGLRRKRLREDSEAIVHAGAGDDDPLLVLDELDSLILQASDDICSGDELMASIESGCTGPHSGSEVEMRLARLQDLRAVVAQGGRYLSLVLPLI
jgi:ribosomal peptide maturation radical SAM protein 1